MSKYYNFDEAFETDGMRNGQPIYCPVNAYGDCPYCDQCNVCHIADPMKDCTDFGMFWESWEEYDSYDEDWETNDSDLELGFNPYEGGYDYDC